MRNILVVFAVSAVAFALSGNVFANCADDAIDTCNKKHPNPNGSSGAYDKYELCIKAQLGQKCPKSNASTKALLTKVAKDKKGLKPNCPRGYNLKINWSGKEDRCIAKKAKLKRVSIKAN